MTKLSQTDYDDMQRWGRDMMDMHPGPSLPPVNNATTALRSAAEYLAIASPAEASFLRSAFLLGLRQGDDSSERKAMAILVILDVKAEKLR